MLQRLRSTYARIKRRIRKSFAATPKQGKKIAKEMEAITASEWQKKKIPQRIESIRKGELKIIFAKNSEKRRVAYSLFYPKPFSVKGFEEEIGKHNWNKIKNDENFLHDLKAHNLELNQLHIGVGKYPTTHPGFRQHGHGRKVILESEKAMAKQGAKLRIIVFCPPESLAFYDKIGYKRFEKTTEVDREGKLMEPTPRYFLYKIFQNKK